MMVVFSCSIALPCSHDAISTAFDNGELKVDLGGVKRMMDELLAVMKNEGVFRPRAPLVIAFKSIWDRLSEVSVMSMKL